MAADVIWKYDQRAATAYFQGAFDSAMELYRNDEEEEAAPEKIAGGLSMSAPDLRLEVIRLVSKRDARLGRRFMDQYVEEKQREREEKRNREKQTRNYAAVFGPVDEAGNDALHVAATLFDVDKNAAMGLAQKAFSKGIPQGAGYLITEIARKDRAAADRLYLFALDRLAKERLPYPGQLLLLASYPFGLGEVWIADGEGVNSYGFPALEGFAVEERVVQRLLSVAIMVLSRNTGLDVASLPDGESRIGAALFAAKLLEPRVVEHHPALLEQWRRLTGALLAMAGNGGRDKIDGILSQIDGDKKKGSEHVSPEDRIEALLASARDATDLGARDGLYQEAALAALAANDLPQALEISEMISSPTHKKKTRSWINIEAAKRAIRYKRLDDARRFALEVESIDQSVLLLAEIARAALGDRNHPYAIEILAGAEIKAFSADATPEKVRALLCVANSYAGFDMHKGFEVMSEVVRTVNMMGEYDLRQAKLVRDRTSPSGQALEVVVDSSDNFDIGKTLSKFARVGFDRAVIMAESLNDQALRARSILSVASFMLEAPAK